MKLPAARRVRLSPAGPLGSLLLGILAALAAVAAGSQTGCHWATTLLYLAAAVTVACLPVRLPASSVSLLPAVLVPAWLSCGAAVTVLLALAAVLAASAVARTGPLATWLAVAVTLGGVFAGDLTALAVGSLVTWPAELPAGAVPGAAFALGVWAGEVAISRIASRVRLTRDVPALPRASLVANLLLVFPATILADVLATRGTSLFALLLVVLVVALALISLYLSAETARRGAAGARERLESIVSQVPDGIFTVRPDLTVEWLNETAARLTGCDPEAAAGRPAGEVVPARRPDGSRLDHRDAFLEAARSGKAVHRLAILTGPDGQERPVVVSYTALTDSPDGFAVGIASIREAPSDDRDAQIADLGHELRSPLTAILGYTGLMLGAAPGSIDAERQAEFIARIAASGDYMLRLVNNLLDLRRMESGVEQLQPSLLQLDRLLHLVVAMARPNANEKQITISLDVEPELPPLFTDELLVRRVVDNLLSNAVKYTPSGGAVEVTARRRGSGVEIAVKDTGIGLTEEEQQLLFQRFFRSNRPEARQERGTGLGLPLVREAIRRLGGEIQVTSQVGVGSTFTVSIPPLAPVHGPPVPAPADRVSSL